MGLMGMRSLFDENRVGEWATSGSECAAAMGTGRNGPFTAGISLVILHGFVEASLEWESGCLILFSSSFTDYSPWISTAFTVALI